ncbi:hypothetical protein DSM112329_04233 [Paraconexibacter sp. AEG42_29]|uniref:HTH tetR-type domain-containing protein n=1 Tax=Paraconexibacter sp. AEG42_29 TaxID=2997339 RepID=A0AAU7B0V7_9ACTN
MPPTGKRATPVDRDAVVAAAVRIIDTDGVSAVTMRRLASDLGVTTMAAYRHVRSKDELLQLVAASVVADIPAAPPDASWGRVIHDFFTAFHDRLVEHPGVALLFGGQSFLSEPIYAVSDHVFTALLDAGFSPESAVALFMGCASCSIGSAVLEAAAAQSRIDTSDSMLLMSARKYPGIAAVAEFIPQRQSSTSHDQALSKLVAGYAAVLSLAE